MDQGSKQNGPFGGGSQKPVLGSFPIGLSNAGSSMNLAQAQYGMATPLQVSLAVPSSGTDQSGLRKQMFGVLNEAGTNVSHVPSGLGLQGQSYMYQHGRFAVSGSELVQLMARHAAGNSNALGAVFNQPGLNPIYRPDFATSGLSTHPPSFSNLMLPSLLSAPNGMPSFPLPQQSLVPTFASVVAQSLPRNSVSGMQFGLQMPLNMRPSAQVSSQLLNKAPDSGAAYATSGSSNVSQRSRLTYDDDVGKSRKRRKRDPNLPTPARFAWNFFFREQYTKIRNSEPSEHSNVQKAFTDIGLDLGKKWKSLSKDEKAPYIKMAEMDRERFDREMRQRRDGSAPSADAGEGSGEDEEDGPATVSDDTFEGDGEKVGIVFHEVEVEDQRDESDKANPPSDAEIVADVLVVDDDEVFLKIVRHRLIVGQKEPLKVMTVTSAEDAKRMILNENKKFGTILMDKNFGEGHDDGISSLQCIRESGYQGVIVGVTGSTDERTKKEFAASGANNTFVKGSSSFYDEVLTLVKLHSSHAELMEKEDDKTNAVAATGHSSEEVKVVS